MSVETDGSALAAADPGRTGRTSRGSGQHAGPDRGVPEAGLAGIGLPALTSTGEWRLARVRVDGGTVVALVLLLLFLLPPRLVLSGLGAAGRPVLVAGAAMLSWWAASRLVPSLMTHGRQPVRAIIAAFLVTYLMSYVAGLDRGLDGLEARSADRGLITTLALCGLTLVVADGVTSRKSLDRLLRRLLLAACAMAVVGVIQFVLRFDLTRYITVPGLSLNRPLIGVGSRGSEGSFARVAGTAGHYIEFGVVLGMLLPIAVHYALFSQTRAERQRRWLLAGILAAGIPFSISRSAVLALGVGLVVLALSWRNRAQFNGLVALLCLMLGMRLLKPGLLGTIQSLFANAENDPSIQNRQSDYDVVMDYVAARPWFGRGSATFVPERYILLDNQYLGTLVSQGVVGLVALVALFAFAFSLARRIRKTARDEETRHLGQALAASVLVAAVSSATFDSFSFTTFACTTFLVFGAIGALWRLDRSGRAEDEPAVERRRPVLRTIRHGVHSKPELQDPSRFRWGHL